MKTNKALLGAAFLFSIFFSSVTHASWKCGENLQVEGFTYTTKKMPDGTCWTTTPMKHGETLVGTGTFPNDASKIEKWCHSDNPKNCDTYGGIYTWYEAMGTVSGSLMKTENTQNSVCGKLGPDWQLPSHQDFLNLTTSPNNCTGWVGNKVCGMTSVKGGDLRFAEPRKFVYLNVYQNWWTANEHNVATSKYVMIGVNQYLTTNRSVPKNHAMSVICTKKTPDLEVPETPKFQPIQLENGGSIQGISLSGNTLSFSGANLGNYDIPLFYDQVEKTYEKGIENPYNTTIADKQYLNWGELTKRGSTSPWKSVSYERSATGAFVTDVFLDSDKTHSRYGENNRFYFGKGDAHLHEARVYPRFNTGSSESKKLYLSWWYKQDNDTRYQFKVQLKDIPAGFNPKENDTFTVPQKWDWRKVTHFNGRVVAFDKETGTLEAVFYGQPNSNYINNRPIVLDDESGTATVEKTLMWQGANKFVRLWESDGSNGTFRFSWTQTQVSGVWHGANIPEKKWVRMEILVDQETRKVEIFINGVKDFENIYTIDDLYDTPVHAPTIGLIGFDSSVPVLQNIQMDDIYLDNKFNRVILSNAAVFSESKNSQELQYYKKWSDSEIVFDIATGSLDTSKSIYMYLFDGNGNLKNQTGILVK